VTGLKEDAEGEGEEAGAAGQAHPVLTAPRPLLWLARLARYPQPGCFRDQKWSSVYGAGNQSGQEGWKGEKYLEMAGVWRQTSSLQAGDLEVTPCSPASTGASRAGLGLWYLSVGNHGLGRTPDPVAFFISTCFPTPGSHLISWKRRLP
jgi:hypothetical protein